MKRALPLLVAVLLGALLSPAGGQAGNPDSTALRQIARNTLRTQFEIERLRSDVARSCRAIAEKSYDCP